MLSCSVNAEELSWITAFLTYASPKSDFREDILVVCYYKHWAKLGHSASLINKYSVPNIPNIPVSLFT